MSDLGSSEEIEPGVIRVILDMKPVDREKDEQGEPHAFDLLITREQLRSVAWSEVDVFDDRDPAVMPKSANPVYAGLDAFSFYTEEVIATARPSEAFLVFYRGRLVPSVRAELPPVRGPYADCF